MPVPLCRKHRNHWLLVNAAMFGGLGTFGAMTSTALGLLMFGDGLGESWPPLGGMLLALSLFFFILFVIFVAVLHRNLIRPLDITKESIRLSGVSADFARAVSFPNEMTTGGDTSKDDRYR